MVDDSAEQWRPIPGHLDYEASDLGRIRSHKRGRTKIMSPFTDKLGYVRLTCAGKRVMLHRLVAAAWHGPCPEGKEVDHINQLRGDNRPANLQYLTRAENLAKRAYVLGEECKDGHPLTGDNLMIRPSTGRRECRTCAKIRVKNRPPSGKMCSEPECDRVADCWLKTDHPICEMHYQRARAEAKRRSTTPTSPSAGCIGSQPTKPAGRR